MAATATARRAFFPSGGERLLEDFDFHGLAAEQALQLTGAQFQITSITGCDDIVIGFDGDLTALGHELPPLEQQAWRDAVQAGDGRDRHPRLHGGVDQVELLIGSITAATLVSGDDFNVRGIIGIGACLGVRLGPHGCARCPGRKRGPLQRSPIFACTLPRTGWSANTSPRSVPACDLCQPDRSRRCCAWNTAITKDGMVSVDGNLYSVPDTTRRRPVEVHSTADEVRILEQGALIAVHPIIDGRGQRRIRPGPARPRRMGRLGAGAWAIVSQARQDSLGLDTPNDAKRPRHIVQDFRHVLAKRPQDTATGWAGSRERRG